MGFKPEAAAEYEDGDATAGAAFVAWRHGSVWSIPSRPKSKRNVHIAQSPSGLSCVLFCSVLFDLLCFIFVWFVWFVLFVPSLTPLERELISELSPSGSIDFCCS